MKCTTSENYSELKHPEYYEGHSKPKLWETRDKIASLMVESKLIDLESDLEKANDLLYSLMYYSDFFFGSYTELVISRKKGRQAGLQIARRGFQVYADTEFDSVEREQKRMRINESVVEGTSSITTPYINVHIPPSRVVTPPNEYIYQSQQELINNISKSTTSAIPASEAVFQEQKCTIHVESTPHNNEEHDEDEEIKINLTRIAEQLRSAPTVEWKVSGCLKYQFLIE